MQDQFNAALFHQGDALLQDIKGHSSHERSARLNVYRNNVYVSLQDALGDIFPVCKQLVGDEFFNAMARQYLERQPPSSPVLSEYGQQFEDFVRHFFPAQSLPYLADLCALEYKLLQLTHDAEPDTLSLAAAQQRLSQAQNPEALALHLHTQCQVLRSPFAVGSLYLAHQETTPDLSMLAINNTEHLLLCKAGLYGHCYLISAAEHQFIQKLMLNPSLNQALPDDDSFELGQTLARLMTWQVFNDINEP